MSDITICALNCAPWLAFWSVPVSLKKNFNSYAWVTVWPALPLMVAVPKRIDLPADNSVIAFSPSELANVPSVLAPDSVPVNVYDNAPDSKVLFGVTPSGLSLASITSEIL